MKANGEQLQHITELIEKRRVTPVLDSVYTLSNYAQAFDRLNSSPAVGKVVLHVATSHD